VASGNVVDLLRQTVNTRPIKNALLADSSATVVGAALGKSLQQLLEELLLGRRGWTPGLSSCCRCLNIFTKSLSFADTIAGSSLAYSQPLVH